VGGVRPAPDHPEAVIIEPHLLPGWRALDVPMTWRGRQLQILIEPDAIEVAVTGGSEGAAPLPIRAVGPDGCAREVLAQPGTRHASRLRDGGYRAWEEISWTR
jgi:kojibiose phosphorylase